MILSALAAAVSACPAPANAAPLSWDQAVVLARQNNPDLKSAALSVESAESSYKGTFSDYFPQISASGGYTKSRSGGVTSNDHSYSLSAQQSIFSGFRTWASQSHARTQKDVAGADFSLTASQTLFDLRSAFVNLLYTQENLALLEKIRARREDNLRLIELRYQAGRENRGSLLRSRAQLSQAKFEVDSAKRELRTVQKRLSSIINAPDFEVNTVTGSFQTASKDSAPDFESLILRTPRYQKAARQLKLSQSAVVTARSDFFPSISVSGSGRRRGDEFPPETDSWSVGASASYAIFSGNRTHYNVQQSKLERSRASQNLVSVRRSLEVSLEDAFLKLQDAAGQAQVQSEFLDAAQERASIARAQYTNGLVTFQDWDIIEGDLISAQKQNLSALRASALSEANWQLSIGAGFQ